MHLPMSLGIIHSLHYLPRFFFEDNWDCGQGIMFEVKSWESWYRWSIMWWYRVTDADADRIENMYGYTVRWFIEVEGLEKLSGSSMYQQKLKRRWTVMLLHCWWNKANIEVPVTCMLYNRHSYKFPFVTLPLLFLKKIIAHWTTILNLTILRENIII